MDISSSGAIPHTLEHKPASTILKLIGFAAPQSKIKYNNTYQEQLQHDEPPFKIGMILHKLFCHFKKCNCPVLNSKHNSF